MVAYDLYHAEEVRESVISKSGRVSSFGLIRRAKTPAGVDNSADTVPLTGLQPVSRLSRQNSSETTDYTALKAEAMLHEEDGFVSSSWAERKPKDFVP